MQFGSPNLGGKWNYNGRSAVWSPVGFGATLMQSINQRWGSNSREPNLFTEKRKQALLALDKFISSKFWITIIE
jgi:hypothetical protein